MRSVLVADLIESDESGFACSKARLVESGLPHLRPFNIGSDGALALGEVYQVDPSEAPKGKAQLQAGDILFNNTNSAELVGKSVVVTSPMTAGFSNHLTRVRVDHSRVDPVWFSFWLRKLQASGYFTANATQWVSQAAYRISDLGKLPIDLPPLADQQRIVDLLSRAEGIVRLRRQAQQKAAALIPAIFVNMFGDPATNPNGWPQTVLGDLIANGPSNGLYKHKSAYGSGAPILRIDAFYDGRVTDLATLKRVQVEPNEHRRFALSAGDIVVNRVNSPEYLGKSAIVPALPEPTVFESNMMRFTVDAGRALPEFVIALLQHPFSRQHFLANAKHAINQSSINQQDVKSLPVFVPPLDLQREFAKRVAAVFAIERQQQAAMVKAEATFSALLAKAFTPATPEVQHEAERALA